VTPKRVTAEWLQRRLGDPNWLLDLRETHESSGIRDISLVEDLLNVVDANDQIYQVYIDQEKPSEE
jgi:hypothetical protein